MDGVRLHQGFCRKHVLEDAAFTQDLDGQGRVGKLEIGGEHSWQGKGLEGWLKIMSISKVQ